MLSNMVDSFCGVYKYISPIVDIMFDPIRYTKNHCLSQLLGTTVLLLLRLEKSLSVHQNSAIFGSMSQQNVYFKLYGSTKQKDSYTKHEIRKLVGHSIWWDSKNYEKWATLDG